MLQQQFNSAQLHSLAAVQQVSCQEAEGEELERSLGKIQRFCFSAVPCAPSYPDP